MDCDGLQRLAPLIRYKAHDDLCLPTSEDRLIASDCPAH